MAKNNFLLEIGIEEVPARFLGPVLNTLADAIRAALDENRLGYGSVAATGTMKRLVIHVEGLEEKQADLSMEVKGPPKNIAFSSDGKPTKAASGFAVSQKVGLEDLIVKKIGDVEYIFALKHEKGVSSKKILKEIIPPAILSLHLPVSMKWEQGDISFIRPIHYIMALLGKETVHFSLGDINSSDKTKGHRFLSDGAMHMYKEGADIKKYEDFLGTLGVILYPSIRKEIILKQIRTHEESTKEQVLVDDALLEEVSNIVENPKVVAGQFDRQFIMVLPQDVIYTVVKKQQKCFPVKDSGTFLIVSDGKRDKEIVSGYEQVVNARLHDAKFFYDEDIKVPLEKNLEKMKKIVYHEKVGSMWDKTKRIVELSSWLAGQLGAGKEIISQVERAAELAKSDLTTHMVGEFSSLAGVMGREYSLVAGEDARISKAIYEHYLPRFAGDKAPSELQGAIVGIADRIDSIVACFAADIVPTGSMDPYGLRRAASGIVAIMLGKSIEISLPGLIAECSRIVGVKENALNMKVLDFIKQRLKAVLETEGVRYDVCDSVLEASDDVMSAYCKAFEIMKVIKDEWFKTVVLAADRIDRIVSGSKASGADTALFEDDEEKSLYKVYCQMKDIISDRLSNKEYAKALYDYKTLTKPVDIFFEKVLVMHQEANIRNNRLALLGEVRSLYRMFADLSRIVI